MEGVLSKSAHALCKMCVMATLLVSSGGGGGGGSTNISTVVGVGVGVGVGVVGQ